MQLVESAEVDSAQVSAGARRGPTVENTRELRSGADCAAAGVRRPQCGGCASVAARSARGNVPWLSEMWDRETLRTLAPRRGQCEGMPRCDPASVGSASLYAIAGASHFHSFNRTHLPSARAPLFLP